MSKAKRAAELVATYPHLAELVVSLGEGAKRGEASYRETHWGDAGDEEPRLCAVPDVSGGLVVLGDLAEIGYVTLKGRGKHKDLWVHKFAGRLPKLCYTLARGAKGRTDLVIVRADSVYTVTDRGIVG